MKRLLLLLLFLPSVLIAQTWTLNECIDYAFKNDLQLSAYELNKQAVEKQLQFQKNTRNPVASINSNSSGARGFQQVFSGNFVGEYRTVESLMNQTSFDASLDLWNTRSKKHLIDKERINLSIAHLEIEDQKQQLELKIISKYYTILIAQERLQISTKVVKNTEEQIRQHNKLYELGSVSKSKLNELQSQLIQDQQSQWSEQNNLEKSILDLKLLLQLDPKDPFEVSPIVDNPANSEFFESESINVEGNSPKLNALEQKIAVTDKEIKNAKTAFYPKLTLNYRIGTSYQQVFEAMDLPLEEQLQNNLGQTVTLGLQIPFYSQGNNRIRVQQNKINKLIATNQYEQEQQQFKSRIATLQFEIESAKQALKLAEQAEKNTQKVSVDVQKKYELGVINWYELNYGQNQYTIAQIKKVQAQYEVLFKNKVLESYSKYSINKI